MRPLILFALIFLIALPASAQRGSIAGVVVDSETGETLVGANIAIAGTTIGTTTDLDGRYELRNVEAGAHDVRFSFIGYNATTVNAVEVKEGEITRVDVRLQPESIGLGEVTVEARALRNNEATLLRDRQKAASVSDAISAEAIGRSGSSTASDAMRKVTGATVVGGKYVYVRGLGDRYMGTQLNGSTLPSADPDRNSLPLDLFPAALLDNIVTTKTFTPDKPGSFTGGMINIGTKAFPEALVMQMTTSMGINTQSTFSNSFLTANGGRLDWLGMDDGSRGIPAQWLKRDGGSISPVLAKRDAAMAYRLDELSRAFDPVMTPWTTTVPMNQSYGMTLGNEYRLFGRPLGFLGSITYDRDFESYQDGTNATYLLTGRVSEVSELNAQQMLADDRSTSEVLWGGLGTVSFKPAANHSVGLTYMYNHTGTSEARYLTGQVPRNFGSNRRLESRVIAFTERRLQSLQASGESTIPALRGLRAEWSVARVDTRHDEPDLRFFANDYTIRDRSGVVDTTYNIALSNYTAPSRYFRTLVEGGWDAAIDFTQPIRLAGMTGSVKAGGALNDRSRDFNERRFRYETSGRYDGDPVGYFSRVGIVDSTETSSGYRYDIASHIIDASSPRNNYAGDQQVTATYGMIDLRLPSGLRLITGARFEAAAIDVASQDSTIARAHLNNRDLLPSLNLVYELGRMNLRGAYGRTVARPTFRELAPFTSFSFINAPTLSGNPALQRTLVDNLDLRWEWFVRPGEIAAISLFHKSFDQPIERTIVNDNFETRYQNVDQAQVYGAELELRTRLDRVASFLSRFELGGNLTLSHSEVNIPEQELIKIRAFDPDAPDRRPLQGQSPFVVNADISYQAPQTTASLYYNVFGRRISEVTLGGTPNIYELPFHSVDLVVSHDFWSILRVKASASNLLDAEVRRAYPYKNAYYYAERYRTGRSFSLSLTYGL